MTHELKKISFPVIKVHGADVIDRGVAAGDAGMLLQGLQHLLTHLQVVRVLGKIGCSKKRKT